MSGEDKPFSIKDRRLFAPEGRLREDEAQEEAQEEAPAGDAATLSTPPLRRSGPANVDFARFLMSLGAQALEALQAQPAALDQAQTLVAVLEMLRDKSEGRRTPEESEVLEGLLYELRMTFVERSRAEPA